MRKKVKLWKKAHKNFPMYENYTQKQGKKQETKISHINSDSVEDDFYLIQVLGVPIKPGQRY